MMGELLLANKNSIVEPEINSSSIFRWGFDFIFNSFTYPDECSANNVFSIKKKKNVGDDW